MILKRHLKHSNNDLNGAQTKPVQYCGGGERTKWSGLLKWPVKPSCIIISLTQGITIYVLVARTLPNNILDLQWHQINDETKDNESQRHSSGQPDFLFSYVQQLNQCLRGSIKQLPQAESRLSNMTVHPSISPPAPLHLLLFDKRV